MNRNYFTGTHLAALVLLSACAAAPGPHVEDKLDARTGSTVSVIPEPVELLTSSYFGARTGAFAFLGPFETDQMGARALYLWVLVPKDVATSIAPVIRCNDDIVTLPLQTGSLSAMGLAAPPYEPPDPWGTQWYFTLDGATLACFAHARVLSLEIPDTKGQPVRFTVESAKGVTGFPVLETFAARRAN